MRVWLGFGLVCAMGCSPQTVTVAGRVMVDFQSEDVVGGAHVALYDETFALVSETDADADGVFFVEAPERAIIHLVVSGDGLAPAAFPGESGDAPGFEVPNGQIFAVTEAQLAQQRADFAGCDGAETGDGVVFGTTYLAVPAADVTDAGPVDSAFAYVEDMEQTQKIDACYLDDLGVAVAPDAELTGDTGRFAIFGVVDGPWVLTLGRRSSDTSSRVGRRAIFVPEGGVVAQLPAKVPLL